MLLAVFIVFMCWYCRKTDPKKEDPLQEEFGTTVTQVPKPKTDAKTPVEKTQTSEFHQSTSTMEATEKTQFDDPMESTTRSGTTVRTGMEITASTRTGMEISTRTGMEITSSTRTGLDIDSTRTGTESQFSRTESMLTPSEMLTEKIKGVNSKLSEFF